MVLSKSTFNESSPYWVKLDINDSESLKGHEFDMVYVHELTNDGNLINQELWVKHANSSKH